jgi:CBS domain-containing protein
MFNLKKIMKTNVITVRNDASVYEAIQLLLDNFITGLPVVDENDNLVGMITEKDVLQLLYADVRDDASVEEFMTRDVLVFSENDNLTDVAECLFRNKIRRVPILRSGKIVGIISKKDIIAYIMQIKKVGGLEMALQCHLEAVGSRNLF